MDASSLRSGDEDADAGNGSDGVEELEAIDADFPYPLILDSNSPGSTNAGVDEVASSRKRRRNGEQEDLDDGDADGDGGVIDGDDYEEQMLQQHRHLRQQQNAAVVTGGLDLPPPQTVREVLNSKFCGFISAKLNSMEDSEADNLMNRILLLLVQMQQCEGSVK
ncbi:GL24980 [Drosophila persimilis]|nr:GL24980 [Drosophila persimilis]